jgi:hypothetical protein
VSPLEAFTVACFTLSILLGLIAAAGAVWLWKRSET